MRGAARLRAERVRAILGGEPIDEEVISGRLGYEIHRHHIALRVATASSEVRGLERAATEVAEALGPGAPLVIPSGAASFDVWWGSFDEIASLDALDAYQPPDGIRVAFGSPAHGVDGFRKSHNQAIQAARVASLAGDAARSV